VPYLEQLEKTGSFRYGGADFFTNGMIREGSDVFDLRNATEEAFSLTVKLGGFFSRKLSVSLRLDHDVIHTLLGRFREKPEDPQKYVARSKAEREQSQAEHHWFFDAIRLCAKMAAADGRIDPDEVMVVKEFVRAVFKLDESMMSRAVALFNEARESATPASFYAQRLMKHHGQNRQLIAAILNLLRDIALSDGECAPEELELLTQISRLLGSDPKASSDRNNTQTERPKSKDTEVNRHGRVLGLSGKVTIGEVRIAYRKLILEHHPDRHHGASPAVQRAAHERMVEINAAYAFFREKYDL
jgi:DnaJ like chaperone protein